MKSTVINVISGKGGTGKTLLACVLADMLGNAPAAKTLVIDLDFFVRGLTSLLYFHREEKLHIADPGAITVSEFFAKKIRHPNPAIAISKYRSFDVVPAVARIDERLNYQDLGPNTRAEATAILRALLSSVPAEYRFVILDSRAGYDELISATHEICDISICVEEEDPISRVTSDNLIAQLSADAPTPIFRLVNKARNVRSQEDVLTMARGVTDLGVVPFDMDILNSFGTVSFWDVVGRSLYRWALARSWNILNTKLQLGVELHSTRLSPVVSEIAEAKLGLFGTKERILFSYGLLLAVFGLLYGIAGRSIFAAFQDDPARLASFLVGFAGIAIAFYAFFRGPPRP
jgi:septum site-determining protein MinD